MADWLSRGASAARVASERSDLWLPGALGWMVYLGWLPLLVAVSPAPQADDLAYLGVRLVAASAFPWNVVALVVALLGFALLLTLLAGLSEVALQAPDAGGVRRGHAPAVLAAVGVIVIASLPVVAAGLALALGIVTVAPGLFLATPSLVEIIARAVRALWPLIAVVGVLLLLAQTFGAVAMRTTARGRGLVGGCADAARDLVRHPLRRGATGAVSMLVDLATLAISAALLRVLWAPIGVDLAGGRLLSPGTMALLLGFVAIWLALVLAAGAARTWLSTWWSMEMSSESPGGALDAS
jgi:hypothetical protein